MTASHPGLRVLCATLLLTLAGPGHAGEAVHLAAPQDRTSDAAIHADLLAYEATQARIQALNDGGRPLRDYHLSKAQCWLDVSFHEYSRNDRSAFPQQALDQAVRLVAGMEQGADPLPTDTPLVNDARHLRDDLWKRLRALHGTPGFACAQQAVACGEVELVHAGNEFNQQQWRHAKPYIQMAEDWTSDAEALARQCGALPAADADAQPVLPLVANVLFEFDRHGADDIRAHSLQSLDRALARIADEDLVLERVELVGHADRLQGQGFDYNQALSGRRAATVRGLLLARGIEPDRIVHSYRGDTEQVQRCDGVSPRAALLECLLPNRRVEVRFIVR